jgi:sigma-E factor negative regulatory protein RseB
MIFMRQAVVLFRFIFAFSLLIPLALHAEGSNSLADNHEAQVLLRKIQSSAQRLNYSGIFVYQQGGQVRTSRITHILDGKNEAEKLEILDGKPREYIRHNDEVICYVPGARTLLIERRVPRETFPAILTANPAELGQYYEVRKEQAGRVAGQDCQAIVLEPKDKLRYGYKLWADKATGLLLRAQTLNEQHEVVEQISFTQIAIGNIDRSQVKPTYGHTTDWHVENARMSPVDLTGWTVRSLPPGFKRIREVKRLVSNTPSQPETAKHVASTHREVAQIVFSDGVAAISVFIEPGSQSRTEGSMQQGALNIVGRRYGDFWLTIVGEVPASAILQVSNSIEYKPK